MDSGKARELFKKFAGAMAYVAVADPDGSIGIGSAFHVGEGVFVTARHVVEGKEVTEVCMTQRSDIPLEGSEALGAKTFLRDGDKSIPVHSIDAQTLRIKKGPYFHTQSAVDVAVFQVEDIDSRTPFVELGGHLDDWLGADDFVLSEAIVFGYPPIPQTNEPHLVAARSEVNALVDVRHAPHVHFILSATPRGGFSGGLAVAEGGFALGVVTSSLVQNSSAAELGFFAVLTVEPIYVCLAENKLLPACQTADWGDFWNTSTVAEFFDPREATGVGVAVRASLISFDDGKRTYVEVRCADEALLARVANAARDAKVQFSVQAETDARTRRLVALEYGGDSAVTFIRDAAEAIEREICAYGLARVTAQAGMFTYSD